MPVSELKLIKRCFEYCEIDQIRKIPKNTRGIYVLYRRRKVKGQEQYNVVYIGMARGNKSGARSRLDEHKESKKNKWTHFSIFEVWENIFEDEVAELEGLFRHIYRKDLKANALAKQRSFKKLDNVREKLAN
jgi:hypothetical protein